jgi:hypothetical protein
MSNKTSIMSDRRKTNYRSDDEGKEFDDDDDGEFFLMGESSDPNPTTNWRFPSHRLQLPDGLN